jgi:hypothetical protein
MRDMPVTARPSRSDPVCWRWSGAAAAPIPFGNAYLQERPMSRLLVHPTGSVAGHGGDPAHHHDMPRGWQRWLFATNHKDIGTMYLVFSFTNFMIGGLLAMMIRLELFEPGLQFFNPEFYNQLVTMHGLLMIIGASD